MTRNSLVRITNHYIHEKDVISLWSEIWSYFNGVQRLCCCVPKLQGSPTVLMGKINLILMDYTVAPPKFEGLPAGIIGKIWSYYNGVQRLCCCVPKLQGSPTVLIGKINLILMDYTVASPKFEGLPAGIIGKIWSYYNDVQRLCCCVPIFQGSPEVSIGNINLILMVYNSCTA